MGSGSAGPHKYGARWHSSLDIDYKKSRVKQYHKLLEALRTETTINDTRDFAHAPACAFAGSIILSASGSVLMSVEVKTSAHNRHKPGQI
jgi:hypothetical protein